MTPLKSIRAHCLWCCLDQPGEVRLCPSVSCALWAYRFGHMPAKEQVEKPSPLKAIRARCVDCVEGFAEVTQCDTATCQLHKYRLGKNPNFSDERRARAAVRMRAAWQKRMDDARIFAPKGELARYGS